MESGNGAPRNGMALLVVDVQKDYCDPEGAFAKAGHDMHTVEALVPKLASLVESARENGVFVVFIRNTVDPEGFTQNPVQRRRRQRVAGTAKYVVDGTWGHELAEPLRAQPGDMVMKKYASSAFLGTPLDPSLRGMGISTVVVTGVVTWGCVMATAQSAAYLGYIPVVVSDCVGGHDQYFHEAALAMMRQNFGPDLVMPSEEVMQGWSRLAAIASEIRR